MAGRLQLIKSVLLSIVNFWMAGFLLPGACLKEINSLCSAFLLSGPELNTRKAKVYWEIVSREKKEGGLGLRSLKDVNQVCCLKLVWRIVSMQPSLWVKWIQTYLIKRGTLWSIKDNTTSGSWMWRKLLKYRDKAKDFHVMKIGNGHDSSFWFDSWSTMGRLHDIFGHRGCIDMGIPSTATVATVMTCCRRRRHRSELLNDLEALIQDQKEKMTTSMDQALWKQSTDKFGPLFQTKLTWELIRHHEQPTQWSRGVWFPHNTPKFAIFHWLTYQNRLTTGDRILTWNINTSPSCVLCQDPFETRDHLFFECPYSAEVWKRLMGVFLHSRFTTKWSDLMELTMDARGDQLVTFLTRHTLQVSIHTLWRERNDRRHGATPTTAAALAKNVDRQVRNRCLSFRLQGNFKLAETLSRWLATRP